MKRSDISDLQVCLAIAARGEIQREVPRKGCWPDDALMEQLGCSRKVARRAMERADHRGYIDYGSSIRSAWLTEKGKQLIQSQKERTI